jgi:thiosulfate dehydrogenase
VGGAASCAGDESPPAGSFARTGPLIAASTTMVTAWEVPENPLTDPGLDDGSPVSEQIRWGYRIFTDTRGEAARFTGATVSCSNCHLNSGQRELALPLVGVAGAFPEHNRRAGRLFGLADRVVDCFLRSENATGPLAESPDMELPSTTSPEVMAVTAFLTWLGRGYPVGESPSWRGRNTIPESSRIPVERLDPKLGEALFMEHCTNCHGGDGQGVQIGDKKAGPLWGPDSWNDGAGAARVYTLAGIIRYMMPYLDPGRLTDEEAQLIARFITSKPRPSYPFKDRDYETASVPPDAVYYSRP